MKRKEFERKQRLNIFINDALPILQERYKVTLHNNDTMYKIIINDIISYDYYPMAEKIRINKSSQYEWKDYKLDKLIKEITKQK